MAHAHDAALHSLDTARRLVDTALHLIKAEGYSFDTFRQSIDGLQRSVDHMKELSSNDQEKETRRSTDGDEIQEHRDKRVRLSENVPHGDGYV